MVVERRLCIDNARGIDPQVERSVKTMNRARNTQATLKIQIDVDIFKINAQYIKILRGFNVAISKFAVGSSAQNDDYKPRHAFAGIPTATTAPLRMALTNLQLTTLEEEEAKEFHRRCSGKVSPLIMQIWIIHQFVRRVGTILRKICNACHIHVGDTEWKYQNKEITRGSQLKWAQRVS